MEKRRGRWRQRQGRIGRVGRSGSRAKVMAMMKIGCCREWRETCFRADLSLCTICTRRQKRPAASPAILMGFYRCDQGYTKRAFIMARRPRLTALMMPEGLLWLSGWIAGVQRSVHTASGARGWMKRDVYYFFPAGLREPLAFHSRQRLVFVAGQTGPSKRALAKK